MAHNFIGGWGVYNIIQDHKLYKKNSIQFSFASLNENDRFKLYILQLPILRQFLKTLELLISAMTKVWFKQKITTNYFDYVEFVSYCKMLFCLYFMSLINTLHG